MTCAWCGSPHLLLVTSAGDHPAPDQQPIALCADRDACRRAMHRQTERHLTGKN